MMSVPYAIEVKNQMNILPMLFIRTDGSEIDITVEGGSLNMSTGETTQDFIYH